MNFSTKRERAVIITVLIAVLMIASGIGIELAAQQSKRQYEYQQSKQKKQYKDQYSELDGNKTPKNMTDESILPILESSRQKYLQALILIQKHDTNSAAKYFESAIETLNKLVSYPNIERNEDFTDLAKSIIEDYETNIKNISALDENASLFIIRDKLFQEIEKMPASAGVAAVKKDTLKSKFAPPAQLTIPMTENEQVQKNINFLTNGQGKKFFTKWLERSTKWFPMMKRIVENEGMPEEIIYLSMIESGLRPDNISKANAIGLWQFMRETGKDYGLNTNDSYWVDERRDPEKSTRAAMRFLRDLYHDLGDWHLALAAYNCGLGCVKRAIRKSGKEKPSFWDIMNKLPKETRYYVPLYIATAKVAMQPEAYGFNLTNLKFEPEYKYDIYFLNESVNLKAAAKAAGISVEELKALNPELIQSITPPDKKNFTLKIPYKTEEQFAANYNSLTDEEKKPFISHKVIRGETLKQIAKKYNVSGNDIIAINDLSGYKAKLNRGDELRIPIGGAPYKEGEDADFAENEPVDDTKTKKIEKSDDYITHLVEKGETIYSIAKKYGVRTTDLRNMNNLSFDDDNIQLGQELRIAKSGKASTQTKNIAKNQSKEPNESVSENDSKKTKSSKSSKPSIVTHKVKRGETLAQIADDYDVTVDAIKKDNKIKKNKLKEGQTLKIKTTVSNNDVAEKSNSKDNEPKGKLSVHKVKKNETLESIAEQYNVTQDQIKKWNPETVKGNTVFANTRLKLYDTAPSKGSSQTKNTKSTKKQATYYKIRENDNLSSIAKKYGVSVEQLMKNNKNLNEKRLKIGQKIKIQ